MNAYKIEILVINFDEMSEQDIIDTLEHTKYPNRCIGPQVLSSKEADIGEWDDDHPLNQNSTTVTEIRKYFL